MNKILCGLLLSFICQAAVWALPADSCAVEKMMVAVNVIDREPVEPGDEFSADIGKVFCWSKIICTQLPDTIYHVWFFADEKKLSVPLAIKYPTMRTWSHKNIIAGDWRVEVQDRSGKTLATESFVVR